MSDATPDRAKPPRFPFLTVIVSLALLFLFLGLMWVAAREGNPLEPPKPEAADAKDEPKLDAKAKLDEVRARNRAALDGVGAKMSIDDAHNKLRAVLKGPNDKMPFPTPEPQR
jgi:hypothetical protein